MDHQPIKTSEKLAQRHFAEPCAESQIDDLTLIGNRRFLESTLGDWKAHSDGPSLALIMLDLDRFKQVNDTLGHEVGDKLLKLVTERLRRTARVQDAIFRLGGDEFIILYLIDENSDDTSGITDLAKSLVEILSRPFLVSGHQINIGASAGISILNQGTENVEDLMRHADLALYDAKDSGRDTFRFFTAELEQKSLDRRAIEINLRRALGLKEFSVLYQPQVDLPDGKVVGFEALLRWNNHERGLVLPNDFIPLAEELGEIHAIGEWVMQTACNDAMRWPEHLYVAVNVSPVQFENPRFFDTVRNALNRSGLPAARLELEITESVLFHKPQIAFEHLTAISEIGVSIAMDDFGTGYSSLSYLNELPFSKIKIDQAFIRGKNAKKSKALVEAIISLGSNLNMKTLAEGVETAAQYNDLVDGGCLGAQGYLIGKPMAVNAVDEFITRYTDNSSKKAA